MTIYDVVKKLTGKIEPVGKTETDGERLGNIKARIELVEEIMQDLACVARHNKDRVEYSMKEIGKCAHSFFTRNEIGNYL